MSCFDGKFKSYWFILRTALLIKCKYVHTFPILWSWCLTRAFVTSFLRFLDHTQRRTTVGRTPLDELGYSAHFRDLYLTTHDTQNRKPSMPLEGFEPIIPVSERPQTYTLYRETTGIGLSMPAGRSQVRFFDGVTGKFH